MAAHDFFSGLDVIDISILNLRFTVKPDVEAGERTLGISLGHDVRVNPDDGSKLMLVLNVGVNVDSPEHFEERGFVFEAQLSGVFGTEGLETDNERKLFVLVNGLSLLYAEARAHLLRVSSAGPLGKVTLPSVNMLNYLRAVEAKTSESETDENNEE